MVRTMLAHGASREAVLEAHPVLEPADIVACLLYATRLGELAAATSPSPLNFRCFGPNREEIRRIRLQTARFAETNV
jgi:hypothetical protein